MRYLSNADIMSLLEKDSELALRLQDYITNNPNYNIRLVNGIINNTIKRRELKRRGKPIYGPPKFPVIGNLWEDPNRKRKFMRS